MKGQRGRANEAQTSFHFRDEVEVDEVARELQRYAREAREATAPVFDLWRHMVPMKRTA